MISWVLPVMAKPLYTALRSDWPGLDVAITPSHLPYWESEARPSLSSGKSDQRTRANSNMSPGLWHFSVQYVMMNEGSTRSHFMVVRSWNTKNKHCFNSFFIALTKHHNRNSAATGMVLEQKARDCISCSASWRQKASKLECCGFLKLQWHPSKRPHLLILSKEFYRPQTKHSNIQSYGGHSH